MQRRTTIEIDEELLGRAMNALGCTTMRATIEEALRRATGIAESESTRLAAAQRAYFDPPRQPELDIDVLRSDEMWR